MASSRTRWKQIEKLCHAALEREEGEREAFLKVFALSVAELLWHTYASLLLSQGEPVLYVSNQLGHSEAQVTLEVYAKWIPNESQRMTVNRLPELKLANGG